MRKCDFGLIQFVTVSNVQAVDQCVRLGVAVVVLASAVFILHIDVLVQSMCDAFY